MGNVSSSRGGVPPGTSGAVPDESGLASRFVARLIASGCFAKCCTTGEANTGGDGLVSASVVPPSSPPSCLKYESARVVDMMAQKSAFESELECQTELSKVHWSELSLAGVSESESGGSVRDHREYFEKLQADPHWRRFCSGVEDVTVGRKLGEGAQADVYEAKVRMGGTTGEHVMHEWVVKVMKGVCALEDLQRQWPLGLGSKDYENMQIMLRLYGTLVKTPGTEGSKFGFVMRKCWGDLRSLIDLRMEHRCGHGPPFSVTQAFYLMSFIASNMHLLHRKGIIHRDLKSSNVLITRWGKKRDIVSSTYPGLVRAHVADWECSVGVVGTGWWRAPEIFRQLKDGIPKEKLEFSEKADVYSFAMTCYEIATGLIPFEGVGFGTQLRDEVLKGARSPLPRDLNNGFREVITACWDPEPSVRPGFDKLVVKLSTPQYDPLAQQLFRYGLMQEGRLYPRGNRLF